MTVITADNPLPVKTSSGTSSFTSASNTITTGGTAQDLIAAAHTYSQGVIQNQSSGTLWVRRGSAATADKNSIAVPPGGMLTFHQGDLDGGQKLSILGATTGQAFFAEFK